MGFKRATVEEKKYKDLRIQHFVHKFPEAFGDKNYIAEERQHKWNAHEAWQSLLNESEFKRLMHNREYYEVATRALDTVEGAHLVSKNEIETLRKAIRNDTGGKIFANALYQLIFGTAKLSERFNIWCHSFSELPGVMGIELLPRNGEAISWPLATVFGFLARPDIHALLIPEGIEESAYKFGLKIDVHQRPSWDQYKQYLEFCYEVKGDLRQLNPKDMINVQTFLALGATEV